MMQEFVQSMKDKMDAAIRGIHTVMPGRIVAFNTATGQATVQPVMKFKTPGGKTMDYPAISGVPVVFPQAMGQRATIAYPVKPGDGCLILVSEQSIDYWMYGAETPTDLAFDLTNSICLPGLFATANPIAKEAAEESAVIIDVSGTRFKVKQGQVQIDADEIILNGKTTINGDTNVTGNTTVSGNVGVTGETALTGSTSVNGNFTTSGGVVNLN